MRDFEYLTYYVSCIDNVPSVIQGLFGGWSDLVLTWIKFSCLAHVWLITRVVFCSVRLLQHHCSHHSRSRQNHYTQLGPWADPSDSLDASSFGVVIEFPIILNTEILFFQRPLPGLQLNPSHAAAYVTALTASRSLCPRHMGGTLLVSGGAVDWCRHVAPAAITPTHCWSIPLGTVCASYPRTDRFLFPFSETILGIWDPSSFAPFLVSRTYQKHLYYPPRGNRFGGWKQPRILYVHRRNFDFDLVHALRTFRHTVHNNTRSRKVRIQRTRYIILQQIRNIAVFQTHQVRYISDSRKEVIEGEPALKQHEI